MWYFLPTHPLILNFYYFVNCYTLFLFVIIIIVYVYIYFLFFKFFLFSLFSFLFSLSSSFFPLPILTYPLSLPHHGDMPPSPFFHHFYFYFSSSYPLSRLPIWPLHFSPFLRADSWTTSLGPPLSQFLDFFSLTTPNADS